MIFDKPSGDTPVIDTVTLVRPYQRHAPEPPPAWRFSRCRPSSLRVFGPKAAQVQFQYDDPISGYHGYGAADYVLYHRASLPRLLFNHNGRLITSQDQIDAGLSAMRAKAGELGTPPAGDTLQFVRVDLAWQFSADPAMFILAHRACRHPRIRSGPYRYGDRSIEFRGRELRISIYDKIRERFKYDGNIVRVEIQVRGNVLRELLGGGEDVTHLDFATCYRAYREILLGFQPSSIPRVSGIAQFLAPATTGSILQHKIGNVFGVEFIKLKIPIWKAMGDKTVRCPQSVFHTLLHQPPFLDQELHVFLQQQISLAGRCRCWDWDCVRLSQMLEQCPHGQQIAVAERKPLPAFFQECLNVVFL